jgi:hypothetical protein
VNRNSNNLFRVLILAVCLVFPGAGRNLRAQSGELVLRAFQHSFPGKTGALAFRDGDWTLEAGGEIYYWAGGRLLPQGEKDRLLSWSPHLFELYPNDAAPPELYSPEYRESLRLRGSGEALGGEEDQHRGFQGALYGGPDRRDIEALLVRVEFLGKKITVHQDIAEAVTRIDREIRAAAGEEAKAGNTGLARFIASLGQAGGYNWRDIRGTRRMSYHSWGLALDLQPRQAGDMAVYWLWERARNPDWMLVPLEKRWKPPARVIQAFEHEGFIWGGKWPLYDTMHFEYRPELHELNRLLAPENASAPGSAPRPGQDLHHLFPPDIAPPEGAGGVQGSGGFRR